MASDSPAPTLSVVCITHDPGAQIVAVLGPLRAVAEEIIVAADDRVSPEDLAAYASVADRVIRYAFALPVERPYAWAHAQCSGDWVLRIDGDEWLSPELIARLPELIARRDRVQYWIPRRWSFPDAGHWLDERPWALDPQLRLCRNDPATLAFPGLMHTAAIPAEPSEIVEEPMYHVDLLLKPTEVRAGKTDTYEELRPGLTAPGGGPMSQYYLPEQWAHRAPVDAPAAHASGVASVVAGRTATPALPPIDVDALPHASREEIDAFWDARPLAEGEAAASLALLERDVRLAPGETGDVAVRVTNEGTARWPGGLVREPLIRLGHRWTDSAGAELEQPSPRTPFSSAVGPGESVVTRLAIVAPAAPGTYTVVADVVHEGVRWLGAELPITVEVAARTPRAEPLARTGAEAAPRLAAKAAGWLRRGR